MSIRIDESAYLIRSKPEEKKKYHFVDGYGNSFGSKQLVSDFLSLSDAISNRSPMEKLAKNIEDINCKIHYINGKSSSLLHKAVEYENIVAIKILLKNGAKPSIKNHNGKTAKDLAKESKNDELHKIFKITKIKDIVGTKTFKNEKFNAFEKIKYLASITSKDIINKMRSSAPDDELDELAAFVTIPPKDAKNNNPLDYIFHHNGKPEKAIKTMAIRYPVKEQHVQMAIEKGYSKEIIQKLKNRSNLKLYKI